MSGQDIDGEQGSSSSDCFTSGEDDCQLIENESSDEESDAAPQKSDVPSTQSDPSSQPAPSPAIKSTGSGVVTVSNYLLSFIPNILDFRC
jgi:hypothetical protein